MNGKKSHVCVAAVAAFSVACGGGDDEESLGSWEGDAPHIAAKGSLNGEDFDFHITGEEAAGGDTLFCEREYEVDVDASGVADESGARHVETKIVGLTSVGGEERMFELELKRHSLQSDAPNAQVTIVPRIDGKEPAPDEMWFEWEWKTPAGDDLYESAAQEGTFTLGKFTGSTPADSAIIPDGEGQVGGFLTAKWSPTEEVSLSFTAACTVNSIEEIVE